MKKLEVARKILEFPLLTMATQCDGLIGNYFRYAFYKNKLKKLGRGTILDRGIFISEPKNVSIGNKTWIDKNNILLGTIEIGNYVHIAQNCLLQGGGILIIKDYVGIASGTMIYSATDTVYDGKIPSPMVNAKDRNPLFKSSVIIEKYAFIGAGCIILPGVKIREGAVIGAGSLVLNDIPSWKISFGRPAKVIKDRPKIFNLG